MPKFKLVKDIEYADATHYTGEIIELPQHVGEGWRGLGVAEPVEDPEPPAAA